MSSNRTLSCMSPLKLSQACRAPACPRYTSIEREPFDLGVVLVDPRVEVVAVPSLHAPLEDLHVLLRHRPRSISEERRKEAK